MKVFLKDIGFIVSAYEGRIPVDGIPVLPINFYNPDKWSDLFEGCKLFYKNQHIKDMFENYLKRPKIFYKTLTDYDRLDCAYIDYWDIFINISEEDYFYIKLKYGDYFSIDEHV